LHYVVYIAENDFGKINAFSLSGLIFCAVAILLCVYRGKLLDGGGGGGGGCSDCDGRGSVGRVAFSCHFRV